VTCRHPVEIFLWFAEFSDLLPLIAMNAPRKQDIPSGCYAVWLVRCSRAPPSCSRGSPCAAGLPSVGVESSLEEMCLTASRTAVSPIPARSRLE